MNLVVLMGRLTKDVEVRYSQGDQGTAIGRYTLAVNRSYKRDGEPDADFINILTFGKNAEFAGKYFKKGQLVAVEGELRISSYTDKEGNKRWSTDVVVSKQHFAESKKDQGSQEAPAGRAYNPPKPSYKQEQMGFVPMDDESDEELPF